MSADELLPDFPFRHPAHDRLGRRRTDEAFLDKAWSDERTRVLVLQGTDLAASEDGTTAHLDPSVGAHPTVNACCSARPRESRTSR